MKDDKVWPIVLGVTAGIVGGIVAGLYIYSAHRGSGPDTIRDAEQLIDLCHQKIKEIEAGLAALNAPVTIEG